MEPQLQAGAARAASGRCLNCAAAVKGKFCAACGQETTLHVASAREFVHEFIGHYIALEGKLWKTLGLLLFRPGLLSAEYIAGRRVRYVQPLRIYLTFSILFFAVLKYGPVDLLQPGSAAPMAAQPAASAPAAPRPSAHAPDEPPAPTADTNRYSTRMGELNPAWEARVRTIAAMTQDEALALFKRSFFSYVPYAMFCVMPVFALYLKLLYLGSGRRYGEHMLFALHTNAFAFLLLGLMAVAPSGWFSLALAAWLVAYLPLAMRRVYGASRLATCARWLVLMAVYMATLAVVLFGTVFTATVVV